MNLERQRISESNPELWRQLPNLPMRLFSGKRIDDEPPLFLNRDGEVIPLNRMSALVDSSVVMRCQMTKLNGTSMTLGRMKSLITLKEIWPEIRCDEETTCAGQKTDRVDSWMHAKKLNTTYASISGIYRHLWEQNRNSSHGWRFPEYYTAGEV